MKYNILNTLHTIYLIVTQKYTNKISVSCYHCYLSLTVEGAKAQRAGELRRDEIGLEPRLPPPKLQDRLGVRFKTDW